MAPVDARLQSVVRAVLKSNPKVLDSILLVVVVHCILVHGGFVPLLEKEEDFMCTSEGIFIPVAGGELGRQLGLVQSGDSAQEGVVLSSPSLAILRYTESSVWNVIERPPSRVIKIAWSSIDQSSLLCHILREENIVASVVADGASKKSTNMEEQEKSDVPLSANDTPQSPRLHQLGSSVFHLSDFFNKSGSRVIDMESMRKTIVSELSRILWPLNTEEKQKVQTDSCAAASTNINIMKSHANEFGGMLIGPHSPIFQNPRFGGVPQGIRYDPIDPLGSNGEPFPDDLHGSLPTPLFAHPRGRPRPDIGGPFFNPVNPSSGFRSLF